MGLLDEHIRHCVKEAADRPGDEPFDEKVEEVMTAVGRMLRT